MKLSFEMMRRNDDKFFRALNDLPLSAVISYLTTPTLDGESVTEDFWRYKDVLMPAAKENPLELQYIYELAPNKELKLELKDYMTDEEEWPEEE